MSLLELATSLNYRWNDSTASVLADGIEELGMKVLATSLRQGPSWELRYLLRNFLSLHVDLIEFGQTSEIPDGAPGWFHFVLPPQGAWRTMSEDNTQIPTNHGRPKTTVVEPITGDYR